MKVTINGKRYDTSKCEVLGEIKHGDNTGITRLIRASDGKILCWFDSNSNGHDIGLRSYVLEWDNHLRRIDDFTMTDEQEARCAALGLIEIVD